MSVTLIVVSIAAALMLLLLRSYQRRGENSAGVDDIPLRTHPVYIPALLNLLDENEEEFLRDWLPRSDCNALLRRRIRVLLQYIDRIADNAAVLQRVGDSARHSGDPAVAKAAEELATLALQTRVYAFLASIELAMRLLLLHCPVHVIGAINKYMIVVATTERLARLQCPNRVQTISAQL